MSRGMSKPFRINLSNARTGQGEPISVSGRGVMVVDASSGAALASITLQGDFTSRTFKLVDLAKLSEPQSFDGINILNDAQPGEWLDIIVTDGPIDFDYSRPINNTINEIIEPVDIAAAATFDSKADVSVNATTTALIIAANPARKRVRIGNKLTNTGTFRIGDNGAGAANGDELPPGGVWEDATTAAIYAYNPGGGAESLTVVEVS
jgi:hypothetical protein